MHRKSEKRQQKCEEELLMEEVGMVVVDVTGGVVTFRDHHHLNASRIEIVRLISNLLTVVINMISGEI